MTAGGASLPEIRSLLRVLAAGRRCAEAGTAFGDGAAAMAETATSVVTVEVDLERAAVAAERLAGVANVELLVGDWRELLAGRGPFGLLFFDSGLAADLGALDAAVDLLEPGGLLVKDDLTPGRLVAEDPVREALTTHPELVTAEVTVAGSAASGDAGTSTTAVVVAARRPRRA